MSEAFLSSEEYDEQAHRLYDVGDYDGALEMLKEGLTLYPNAVELAVGLGYARLAREEFAWARRAFERALVLDATHEDALVGMGEALLRLGHRIQALRLFNRVERMGFDDDIELMLTMGRALYRDGLHAQARDVFGRAIAARPDNAEAIASLGYTLHRLGDDVEAARQVRRALRIDPDLHEARAYLGHLLYDRGDWEGSLREFEQIPPSEHWDALAVWRILELKRALWLIESGDARLAPWERRLRDLEELDDPINRVLAEVEARVGSAHGATLDPSQLELFAAGWRDGDAVHRVRTRDGHIYRGTWSAIVRAMRDAAGFHHEPMAAFMRRMAERWLEQEGVRIPFGNPEVFLRAAAESGLMSLEAGSDGTPNPP